MKCEISQFNDWVDGLTTIPDRGSCQVYYRRREDAAYITHRIDLINRSNPIRFLASLIGGVPDIESALKTPQSEADRIEQYYIKRRSGLISIDKYNLLLGKAISHNTAQITV